MRIRVLGSSAGGGFPQWNCNCRNCSGVRGGTIRARPRTQSSIAVTAGPATAPRTNPLASERGWALVNASPDILYQLHQCPELQPARAVRDTAIAAIVLVDGQVDHTAGLLMLREAGRPWPLWCTDPVYADLMNTNPILRVLQHYCGTERRSMPTDGTPFVLDSIPNLSWQALCVTGKAAPYSAHRLAPVPGDNVALLIADAHSGGTALYAPGLATIDAPLWHAMQSASCVLVDGTFWTDEEMLTTGVSAHRARDLGHLAQSGEGGMLEWLAQLPSTTRKILIHINNTNPILDEDSHERAELDHLGVEVAWDGMEICL